MRKVTVFTHLTLDGVMQAPGTPDEDTTGGFKYGGWEAPYGDSVMGGFLADAMGGGGDLLLGRRTYEHFATVWPNQHNQYADAINNSQKYVASTTLKEPLAWSNAALLKGDAAEAVAVLKDEPGKDLVALGSGQFVQSLMHHDLVDEYVLMIHPLVLGSGKRLFADGGAFASLELVSTTTTTKGVLITTYRPALTSS